MLARCAPRVCFHAAQCHQSSSSIHTFLSYIFFFLKYCAVQHTGSVKWSHWPCYHPVSPVSNPSKLPQRTDGHRPLPAEQWRCHLFVYVMQLGQLHNARDGIGCRGLIVKLQSFTSEDVDLCLPRLARSIPSRELECGLGA